MSMDRLFRGFNINNFNQTSWWGASVQMTMLIWVKSQILVAPAVMAAACYMAFGRIILWVVPPRFQTARYLWLPARRITPIFVGADIFSFFVQVGGGGIVAAANTQDELNRGKNILLFGLGLQLAAFGFFVVATFRLHLLLKKTLQDVSLPKERNWELFLQVINVASVVILCELSCAPRTVPAKPECFLCCCLLVVLGQVLTLLYI